MTSRRFLIAGFIAAAALGTLPALLPDEIGSTLAKAAHPAALAVAGALSIWVALMYRGEMRVAFLLIAGFLLAVSPTASSPLIDRIADGLGGSFFRTLLLYQIAAYALLVTAAWFILRSVDVRRLTGPSVGIVAAAGVGAVVLVVRALGSASDLADVSTEAGVSYVLIRLFDVAVVTAMVPVVLLYGQSAKARYQESLSFAAIAVAIMLSLVLAYLYEVVSGEPLASLALDYQTGGLLDGLYLAGYLMLIVGLVAHRKHQDWSFARAERLLR